jgi:methyltransferase
VTGAALLLGLVTAERIAELAIARRNTTALLRAGAQEIAPGHYPAIVALHALWLAALWILGRDQPIQIFWIAAFIALQILRAWVLFTLGRRWTTRILVLPGAPLVARGPYLFLNHPNYVVVIGEIAALPLCLGLNFVAVVFSAANAIILAIRIRAEDAALSGARGVAQI